MSWLIKLSLYNIVFNFNQKVISEVLSGKTMSIYRLKMLQKRILFVLFTGDSDAA